MAYRGHRHGQHLSRISAHDWQRTTLAYRKGPHWHIAKDHTGISQRTTLAYRKGPHWHIAHQDEVGHYAATTIAMKTCCQYPTSTVMSYKGPYKNALRTCHYQCTLPSLYYCKHYFYTHLFMSRLGHEVIP